uniref:Secreted protein n=1 Tax=Echinococcus granulosus TaxID=6210 RepID=A0A068WBH7_ECHGR|nr:hypothetical protein EgrG_000978900 [Echinococcus granulosus]
MSSQVHANSVTGAVGSWVLFLTAAANTSDRVRMGELCSNLVVYLTIPLGSGGT